MEFLRSFTRIRNLISRCFKETPSKSPSKSNDRKKNAMMKFDIIKIIEDEGPAKRIPENGVLAPDANTLRSIYAACGERIEIVRAYDDNTTSQPESSPEPTPSITGSILPPIPESTSPSPAQFAPPPAPLPAEEFRYFTIGDTECRTKGKLVQERKWVKVEDADLAAYRIRSKKTGKEVSFIDKTLEILQWVDITTK